MLASHGARRRDEEHVGLRERAVEGAPREISDVVHDERGGGHGLQQLLERRAALVEVEERHLGDHRGRLGKGLGRPGDHRSLGALDVDLEQERGLEAPFANEIVDSRDPHLPRDAVDVRSFAFAEERAADEIRVHVDRSLTGLVRDGGFDDFAEPERVQAGAELLERLDQHVPRFGKDVRARTRPVAERGAHVDDRPRPHARSRQPGERALVAPDEIEARDGGELARHSLEKLPHRHGGSVPRDYAPPVLTVFSIPKAFTRHVGVIQRNAVRSWVALGEEVQVVLVGDDSGVAEAARDLGVGHVSAVARSELGTPRIDDAFAGVDRIAEHSLRCFVNADVVLLDDFLPAVAAVRAAFQRFLVIGETRDLALVDEGELRSEGARAELRRRALGEGRSRGATAIDYFVFPAGLFDPMPPFVVGRARFDNWLVWRARRRGSVVDATRAVVAVHQSHDYAHVSGGLEEAHFGGEAIRNEALALEDGGIYTIFDASHRMRADRSIYRYPGSTLRAREQARKLAWKLANR